MFVVIRAPAQVGFVVKTAVRRHLFVCTNDRASGKPACGLRGGPELVAAVQNVLIRRGVDAQVTPCGCLGPCFDGPNAVVYPDGVWYGELDAGDAEALAEHLAIGAAFSKRREPPGG
jgi:(2Fe-2S) ferredoxin